MKRTATTPRTPDVLHSSFQAPRNKNSPSFSFAEKVKKPSTRSQTWVPEAVQEVERTQEWPADAGKALEVLSWCVSEGLHDDAQKLAARYPQITALSVNGSEVEPLCHLALPESITQLTVGGVICEDAVDGLADASRNLHTLVLLDISFANKEDEVRFFERFTNEHQCRNVTFDFDRGFDDIQADMTGSIANWLLDRPSPCVTLQISGTGNIELIHDALGRIQPNDSITTLNWIGFDQTPSLSHSSSVEELNIQLSKETDPSELVGYFRDLLGPSEKLKHLTIKDECDRTPKQIRKLHASLGAALKENKSLHKLDIDFPLDDKRMGDFAAAISAHPNLREVRISGQNSRHRLAWLLRAQYRNVNLEIRLPGIVTLKETTLFTVNSRGATPEAAMFDAASAFLSHFNAPPEVGTVLKQHMLESVSLSDAMVLSRVNKATYQTVAKYKEAARSALSQFVREMILDGFARRRIELANDFASVHGSCLSGPDRLSVGSKSYDFTLKLWTRRVKAQFIDKHVGPVLRALANEYAKSEDLKELT